MPIRSAVILAAVLMCATQAALAQYIEKVLPMPDTLAGACWIRAIAVSPQLGRVYVGDTIGCLYVLDAATMRNVARIPVGDAVRAIWCSPEGSRVFCGLDGGDVAVVDVPSDTVVKRIRLGGGVLGFSHNPQAGRLYGACYDLDSVAVIDLTTEELSGMIGTGDGPTAVCYNPASNKFYTADHLSGTVSIFDAGADTLIRVLDAGGRPATLVCNDLNNKVYCNTTFSLLVIDGARDALRTRHSLTLQGISPLCYSRVTNRVYAAESGPSTWSVHAIDGVTDRIVGHVELDHLQYSANCMTASSVDENVYCTGYRSSMAIHEVATIDGAAMVERARAQAPLRTLYGAYDSIQRRFVCVGVYGTVASVDGTTGSLAGVGHVGWAMRQLCYDSAHDRVYGLNPDNLGAVVALDAATNMPGPVVRTLKQPFQMVLSSLENKLFVTNNKSDSVSIIGTDDHQLLANVPVDNAPCEICYAPTVNKVYVNCSGANPGTVAAIDAHGDSLLRLIGPMSVPAGDICFVPLRNRVYVCDPGVASVHIIDCDRDTIVTSIRVGGHPVELLVHPRLPKVYCMTGDGGMWAAIIDARAETLVTRVLIDSGAAFSPNCAAYNSVNDRLYCAIERPWDAGVKVLDCAADTVMRRIRVPNAISVYVDSLVNKAYCIRADDSVSVIDCAVDRVTAGIRVTGPWCFALGPVEHRVFISSSQSRVYVLKDTASGVSEGPEPMVPRTTIANGVLRLPAGERAEVFDAAGRRVAGGRAGVREMALPGVGVFFVVSDSKGPAQKVLAVR